MKKPASRFTVIAGVLAVACLFAVVTVHAANNDSKSDAKKKKPDAGKYDRNANGKLDPDEEAAMKADAERQKAEKKKRTKRGN